MKPLLSRKQTLLRNSVMLTFIHTSKLPSRSAKGAPCRLKIEPLPFPNLEAIGGIESLLCMLPSAKDPMLLYVGLRHPRRRSIRRNFLQAPTVRL
jgi:hypothetical protein